MKKIVILLSLVLITSVGYTQVPAGFASPKSNGFASYGYLKTDSAGIAALRDTSFNPKYAGTWVYWQNSGVDSAFWVFNGKTTGRKWQKVVMVSSSTGGYVLYTDTSAMLSGYKTYYPRAAISGSSVTGILYNNNTGVISGDTIVLATRLRVQKGIDSLGSTVVHNTGNETIAGLKSFTNNITSTGFIKSGATANDILLGDGSLGNAGNGIILNAGILKVDTGRTNTSPVTGGSLNKVRDSVSALVAAERSRAEYVESTKADASDVFQTITVEYSTSGWNASKTQFTFSANLPNYNVFNNTIGRYLLASEVTKTITSFTLTDTARTGDVFFVTGALGAPSTVTSTSNAGAERIAKMRSKLQAKSTLGIGLISLSEISVTQSNPYNLLFWYDGAIVWPLKKVDSVFNPLWKEGGILYIDSIGGKWESISVARMNDPSLASTVRTYYVQYSTGVDDTTRGSYATPFKRLSYAHTRATTVAQRDGYPYEVRILDEWVGTDGGFVSSGLGLTMPDGVKGKYIGYNSSGKKTRLVGMRESYTDALFNWQYIGFGTWASYSSSINTATKQSLAQFDLLYRDADSAPMPLYYVAPLVDSATTITAIQNRPASFGYFGTGSMYVHTFDGRVPSVDNWVYDEGISDQLNFKIGEGSIGFFENIERYFTVASVASAGIRARPITVPSSYSSHTGQFWLYNCGIYGASGQGLQIYDMQYGGTEWLVCKYNREDGENYHSFNTYAYSPNSMGSFMNLWSNFSITEHLGETNFRSQPTLGESVNAISAHDKINLISLNSFGGYAHGSVSAHVLGAQVLQMNCHYYFPTQLPFLGPPGSGSPKTPFWADSDGISPVTKFTVIGCSGNTFRNTNIFSSTNSAVLNYYLQAGKTTSETYNGGTVNSLNY